MPNLVGTDPNQVPVCGMLGTAAFMNADQLPVSAPQQAALDAKVSNAALLESGGAGLIGYTNSGADAVATDVQTKLREFVSVKDFGAKGDGSDATSAFSAAAKGAPATVNIVGAEGTLPRAPMCLVIVPAGSYVLSSEIDTGNREVIWDINPAAVITGYSYLNGEVYRAGQRQADYHHGTTDYACTYSIRSNTNLEDGAEVLGIASASQLATYTDRDSVGLYVDNTSPAALVDVSSATYTSTTVTITAPSASTLKKYRRGMIVDTKHGTPYSGMVDSWNSDGSVLTVTAWYLHGGGGSTGTPNDGTGCVVNGFTKIWAHNANVFLSASGYATTASGFELGLFNSKGDSSSDFNTTTNRCWGFDSVNLGTYYGQASYVARGKWRYGYLAASSDVGFRARQCLVPYSATNASEQEYFRVTSVGSLELGLKQSPSTLWIDFNTSGLNNDYDSRILATSGSASDGGGTLTLHSGLTNTTNKFLAGGWSQTGTSAGVSVIESQSSTQSAVYTARYTGNDVIPPTFHFVKDRSGGDVQSGDSVGQIRFEGANTAAYRRAAAIDVSVSGTPSSTSMPGKFSILVTKAGTTTPATALTIQPDHHIAAGGDNAQTLGTASLRWSVVYAGAGTINTSDEREKQDIDALDAAELRVAATLKGLVKKFRFIDAAQSKGDAARIHVGVIAQEVIEAFKAENLDATRYGIICYDEWGEAPAQFDEEGNIVQEYRPAGNRYGVRYEELLSFIIAAL